MTTGVAAPRAAATVRLAGYHAARRRFPPRPAQQDWPATRQARDQALGQLATALASKAAGQPTAAGIEALLDWLEDQEGGSWQERWLASGAEALGAAWLQLPAQWLLQRAGHADRRASMLPRALVTAICGDIVRPSLAWLVTARYDTGLAPVMAAYRDPAGFARLAGLCDYAGGGVPKAARSHTLRRAAVILAAKGGTLAGIELGDVLELLDTEADVRSAARADAAVCYRLLRQLGNFGPAAPMRLRELRTAGQRTPEQMIDRHNLACHPIRDLLVAGVSQFWGGRGGGGGRDRDRRTRFR
jgi:hypothetical protein